jgi:hypothetical protein
MEQNCLTKMNKLKKLIEAVLLTASFIQLLLIFLLIIKLITQ